MASIRAVLVIAVATACSTTRGQGRVVQESLQHDGLTRNYSLYVPEAYTGDAEWPLVINMHGGTLTASDQMARSGMNAVADTGDFLVVYPQAVGSPTGWNNREEPGRPDDVGFISTMLDELDTSYRIDSSRLYATGLSNGGGMSYLLGRQLADRIAAVASVAGPFIVSTPRPLPVLHIHGTADPVAPYEGGTLPPPFPPIELPAVADVIDAWRENNHSVGDPITLQLPDLDPNDSSTVQLFKYQDGAHYLTSSGKERTADVLFYRVEGGGHGWPGGGLPALGALNRDINASAEIWNFFSRHELPAVVPEPSTLALCLLAFLSVSAFRRR